jgi:hypothetical protein
MQAVLGKWLMPQDNAPGMRKRCCTLIMLPPDDGTTRVPASPVCPLRLYQLMLRLADSTEMESARNAILATKCLSCVKSTTSRTRELCFNHVGSSAQRSRNERRSSLCLLDRAMSKALNAGLPAARGAPHLFLSHSTKDVVLLLIAKKSRCGFNLRLG